MDMDLTDDEMFYVADLLENWGPGDMSNEREEMLNRVAKHFRDCASGKCALHIN